MEQQQLPEEAGVLGKIERVLLFVYVFVCCVRVCARLELFTVSHTTHTHTHTHTHSDAD